MVTTAERLREALRIRNMKQVDLVERTGITKGALSSYLSGRYEPKQNNLHALARALEVNEAWLMGFEVDMNRYADDIDVPFPSYSDDTLELIKKYEQLSVEGKSMLQLQADMLIKSGYTMENDIKKLDEALG